MSDPNPTPDPKPQADSKQSDSAEPLGEGGKKALDAERDARAAAERKATALQKQLDEISAAKLSDLEKAQKKAAEAEKAVEQARQETLMFRIAAENDIKENIELILTGSDEETMRKQAALWNSKNGDKDTPAPRPDLSQGGKAADTSGDPDGLRAYARDLFAKAD